MNIYQKQPAEIASIFVGKPKVIGQQNADHPMEREWKTSIFKEPFDGQIFLGMTNLEGDEQADLKHHGGPEKAVFSYPSEHYHYWQNKLGNSEIKPGGMGENFSTINLQESDVAIGDIYEVGEAVIQVSQPRQPCWKPARRFQIQNLAILLQNSGRTGWYYRVLQEGFVEAGQSVQLRDRVAPEWTIEKCNQVMHIERENFEKAAALAAVSELATNWKKTLLNRIEMRKAEDIHNRVFGPNVE
ncbi:MOSC domain-containing protein [Sporosarcina newyorkensis]|nr:MOSC domain-containing protein [Sporosarcina newyorkensis]